MCCNYDWRRLNFIVALDVKRSSLSLTIAFILCLFLKGVDWILFYRAGLKMPCSGCTNKPMWDAVPSPFALNGGHDSALEGLGKTGRKDIGCCSGLASSVTDVLDFTVKIAWSAVVLKCHRVNCSLKKDMLYMNRAVPVARMTQRHNDQTFKLGLGIVPGMPAHLASCLTDKNMD